MWYSQAVNFKHGLSTTTEYTTWHAMIVRCTDPRDRRYARYGGRGIQVCPQWRNDFLRFLYDMGKRPTPAHQLDRKDNNGHYTPENCRWVTAHEQAMNRGGRRATVYLTWESERLTLLAWAERTGIPHKRLQNRYYKGWSTQRILTEPYHAVRHTHD